MYVSPRNVKKLSNSHQSGSRAASVSGELREVTTAPKVTSASATKSAMRASDLCQKMTAPTANQTIRETMAMVMQYAAKKPTEIRNTARSSTLLGVRSKSGQLLGVQI